MPKSNVEIIASAAIQKGFNYTGDNLFTYKEWEDLGYAVKQGQRAFIKTRLWSLGLNRRMIPASLFTSNQVVRVDSESLIHV